MRVAFLGSPEFAVPSLRALAGAHDVALVVSQPDKPAGRGAQLTAPAVKLAAIELGLPVIQPKSARTGELEAALRSSGAELAVVVAYGKILPPAVLGAIARGCINVHGSLLPHYRGAAPVQWAVIHGEPETGVAIMQLDEGMDTGPVYLERRVAIDREETSGELLARLAPIGAAALIEVVAAIATGTARATAQDHAIATHAPMLTKADGAIDFQRAADEVAGRIRGVDPWPGAHAMLRDQIVKLFRARVTEMTAGPAVGPEMERAGLRPTAGPEMERAGLRPTAGPEMERAGLRPTAGPEMERAGLRPTAGPEMERAGLRPTAGPEMERAGLRPTAGPEMERAGLRPTAGPEMERAGLRPTAGPEMERAGLRPTAGPEMERAGLRPTAGPEMERAGLRPTAGTIVAIDGAGVHVVCGNGVVAIREIQAAGRKRMTAAQFAAGRGIAVGDKLSRPQA